MSIQLIVLVPRDIDEFVQVGFKKTDHPFVSVMAVNMRACYFQKDILRKTMMLVEDHLNTICGASEATECDYETPQVEVDKIFEQAKADYAEWKEQQEIDEAIDKATKEMSEEEIAGIDERKPTLVQDLSKWKGKH